MTVREMLELAAKAAGMTVLSPESDQEKCGEYWFWCEVGSRGPGLYHSRNYKFWNSIEVSRDAFRLAVNLMLTIYHDENKVIVDKHAELDNGRVKRGVHCEEEIFNEVFRTQITRFAITHVAAMSKMENL